MRRITLAVMLTVWGAALAGCGSSSSTSSSSGGGDTGTVTSTAATSAISTVTGAATGTANCPVASAAGDGGGVALKIGSKNFAEEQILAEIARQALGKAGYKVDFSTQEADPQIGQDLAAGKIDMYWQYTGTELQKYLSIDQPEKNLDKAFEQARSLDDPKGLCWTGKAPMNDTNGIAIRSADVARFGDSLSAFTTYIGSHSDVKICIMAEFKSRADGVPGLQAAYGDVWGGYNYTTVDKTAEKNIAAKDCDAGEVFTTDSGIAANDLKVLQDDKTFFPPDNVGLIIRSEILKAHPGIAAIINPIAAKITTDVITRLNKAVEIDGKKPADVAAAWLAANG